MKKEIKQKVKDFILSSNVKNHHICIACSANKNGKCSKETLPKLKFQGRTIYEVCSFYKRKDYK